MIDITIAPYLLMGQIRMIVPLFSNRGSGPSSPEAELIAPTFLRPVESRFINIEYW
jgi:hypothetical protein